MKSLIKREIIGCMTGSRLENKTVHKTVKKWGSEHLITNSSKYCVKVMTLEPGTRCSLHFHRRKTETFVLVSGQLTLQTVMLQTGEYEITELLHAGDSVTLEIETPHTFYCPEGQIGPTVFVEASTEDFIDDSYRINPSIGKNDDSGGSDS